MTRSSVFPINPKLTGDAVPDVPQVRLSRGASLSIPDSSSTDFEWDTVDYDTDGFADLVADDRYLTVPTGMDGTYMIYANLQCNANATGRRIIEVQTSGGTRILSATYDAPASGSFRGNVCGAVELAAGDIIKVVVYQDTGFSMPYATAYETNWFGMHQIMPANVIGTPVTSSGSSHQIVTSTTRPSVVWEGLKIYETDTDRSYVHDGTDWQPDKGFPGQSDSAVKTTDDSTSSTTYVDVDNSLDLTVKAAVGDKLLFNMSGRWEDEAVRGDLDAFSLVGGTEVNAISGGSATDDGVTGWSGGSSVFTRIGGSILYTVVAGDIEDGTATFRLRFKVASAVSKTLRGTSDHRFQWSVVNLGGMWS